MLLFQMELLEKLELLQNSQHVILAQRVEVQIGKGTILEVELLLQIIVLLTAIDLDLPVFDRLELRENFRNQASLLISFLFATEVRVVVSDFIVVGFVVTEVVYRSQ